MMKRYLFIVAISLTYSLSLFAIWPFGRKAQDDCNYLCSRIPAPSDIEYRMGEPEKVSLTSPTLTVLAWNVYKGRKDHFSQDFSDLTRRADIVMLSEATTDERVLPSISSLKDFGWAFGTSFYMKNDIRTGVVTGSYARPKNIAHERTTDLEPFVKSPKVIILTTYFHQPSRQKILTINIHGINIVSTEKFKRQIKSVEKYISRHIGPVIFAGDFNMKNAERMAVTTKILSQYGMSRLPWTNPNSGKQLDDGFYRGFQVKRAELINSVIDHGSDHPALWMELIP